MGSRRGLGKVIEAFLPRAFRRSASEEEVERRLALFRSAQKRGETFDGSILFALQGVLISPHFLFRLEEPNPGPRLAGDYALATRLSYFLWGSMSVQIDVPDSRLSHRLGLGLLQ